MDSINLNIDNKKYNSIKVLLDSDDSNAFNLDKAFFINNISIFSPKIMTISQITNNSHILNKLYIPCIENKLFLTIKKDKYIIAITSKLEEVYTNLWRLYRFISQSRNAYINILIYKYTQKI